MPGLQSSTGYLNQAFGKDHIKELTEHRDVFAPGRPLRAGLKLVLRKQPGLYKFMLPYIEALPASFQEVLRSVIFFALSTKPPTQITFAWAPGYDAELSIWHAPDTGRTRGGITVMLKSRYPNDPHPVSGRAVEYGRNRA